VGELRKLKSSRATHLSSSAKSSDESRLPSPPPTSSTRGPTPHSACARSRHGGTPLCTTLSHFRALGSKAWTSVPARPPAPTPSAATPPPAPAAAVVRPPTSTRSGNARALAPVPLRTLTHTPAPLSCPHASPRTSGLPQHANRSCAPSQPSCAPVQPSCAPLPLCAPLAPPCAPLKPPSTNGSLPLGAATPHDPPAPAPAPAPARTARAPAADGSSAPLPVQRVGSHAPYVPSVGAPRGTPPSSGASIDASRSTRAPAPPSSAWRCCCSEMAWRHAT
jgi:hypothetical protein